VYTTRARVTLNCRCMKLSLHAIGYYAVAVLQTMVSELESHRDRFLTCILLQVLASQP
jgi:hypothetical protein